MKSFCWVYMLRCGNGSFYTGYSSNLVRRYWQHLHGVSGSRFVAAFKPVSLACCWRVFGGSGDGLRIEAYIKRQSRIFKERLAVNPDELELIAQKEMNLKVKSLNAAEVEKQAAAYGGNRKNGLP